MVIFVKFDSDLLQSVAVFIVHFKSTDHVKPKTEQIRLKIRQLYWLSVDLWGANERLHCKLNFFDLLAILVAT